jgi:ribosomal protein S18 acetylase RimI-like enzyme
MNGPVRALEEVMVDGWRAIEEEHLGGWLLRASCGFTSRGNSALPLADPGHDLPDAVDLVEQWYAARDLPTRVAIADVDDSAPLVDELAQRGYQPTKRTLVATAETAAIPELDETAPQVTVDTALTRDWLDAFAAYRSVLPGVTEQLLTGSASQWFLSIRVGQHGALSGIARMTESNGWAGLHTVWVHPGSRRSSVATTLASALAVIARQRKLANIYTLVEESNSGARTMYEAMGFAPHHTYYYLRQPEAARGT